MCVCVCARARVCVVCASVVAVVVTCFLFTNFCVFADTHHFLLVQAIAGEVKFQKQVIATTPFHNFYCITLKNCSVAMQRRHARKRLKPNSDRFKLMHLFHKNAINSPFNQLGIIEFEMMLVRSPTFIVDVALPFHQYSYAEVAVFIVRVNGNGKWKRVCYECKRWIEDTCTLSRSIGAVVCVHQLQKKVNGNFPGK